MPMYEDFTDNNRNRRLFSPGFERLAFQISMQKNTMANHQSFQRHTDSESVHLAFQVPLPTYLLTYINLHSLSNVN